MNWRKFLYPLSIPYQAITTLRNWAFDEQILPSREFEVPIIAVGNLSTGGTGKTPMVEFLIRHFPTKKIGLVSRGYGRKTKGLIVATPDHRFDEIGDEPYQIFHKFPDIQLALSEKRVDGIQALLENDPPDLILLDDAYQHRYVKPGFQILLTTYGQPFFEDAVLPAGNLRESKRGRKRADMIVVTKCPDALPPAEAEQLKKKLKTEEHQSVYFSGLEYGEPINQLDITLPGGQTEPTANVPKNIMVVSGIANPTPMLEHLGSRYSIAEHLRFPDHHHFSPKDIADLEQKCLQSKLPIVTTEKDWVRLKDMLSAEILKRTFYLPLQTKILFGEEGRLLQELQDYLIDESPEE